MPIDDRPLMQQIHRVLLAWNDVVRSTCRNLSLPASYHSILLYLSHHQTSSQKDIADSFHLTPSAVSQTIRHMKEDGLLKQEQQENDGRFSVLKLTQQGKLKAAELTMRLEQADRKLTEALTIQKKHELQTLLTRLQQTIDSTLLHD